MPALPGLSVVIQAGGELQRMGRDKGLVALHGEPLVARQVRRLGGLGQEVLVTTNRKEAYAFLIVRLESDRIPGRGALGGLYTALSAAAQPLAAVVACDMPFASPALLALGWELLQSGEWDAVVPHSAGAFQPFHAVYHCAACLPLVEAALHVGLWRVDAWFTEARCTLVGRRRDPGGRSKRPGFLEYQHIRRPAAGRCPG